jgi:hypothetical protein
MSTDTPIPDIIVPDVIQAIFDKADADGPYAAKILAASVQLTSRDGRIVHEEVQWPEAAKWSRNAIAILSRITNDPTSQHTS